MATAIVTMQLTVKVKFRVNEEDAKTAKFYYRGATWHRVVEEAIYAATNSRDRDLLIIDSNVSRIEFEEGDE